jgi:hypothetical protein
MKKIKHSLLLLLPLVALLSCQEEYKAPTSAVVAMSGKWWYELSFDANQDGIFNEDDGDEKLLTYADYGAADLLTSNTNANDADSVFITDQIAPAFGQWPFSFNAAVDLGTLTFKPGTYFNPATEGSVNLIEGKILTDAATTLSGGKADSIFFRFEFSEDEGSHYLFSGHRDTGLSEDHY